MTRSASVAALCLLLLLPTAAHAQDDEGPPLRPPIPLGSVSAPLPPDVLEPGSPPVTIMVQLAVDEQGAVTDAAVAATSGFPELDAAAERAARALQFFPAYQGADPVAVTIEYPFVFLAAEPPPPVSPPAELSGRIEMKGSKEPAVALQVVLLTATPKADLEDEPDSWEDYDLAEEPTAEAVTDADGTFSFGEVPAGLYVTSIGGPGLKIERFVEELAEGSSREVVYRVRPTGMPETVVVARRESDTPERVLTRDELRKMPGAGGDPLAAVQSLPGVVHTEPNFSGTSGESTQAPVLRGASAEDSVLYLDGLPIPIIFHPLSNQSITGDFLVDRAYLQPAATDAKFGDLTGGVVGVDLRDPRSDRVGGFFEPGFGLTSFGLEGPITKKSRFYFGIRRSYYEVFFRIIAAAAPELNLDFATAPFFQDQQVILQVDPVEALRLTLGYLGTTDGIRLLAPEDEDDGTQDLVFDLNTNLHRFFVRLDGEAPFGLENRAQIALTFWGTSFNFANIISSSERHTTLHIADDVEIPVLPWLEVNAGILGEVDWVRISEDAPPAARENQSPGSGAGLEDNISGSARNTRGWVGGYVGGTFKPVKWLSLTPEFRFDYFGSIDTSVPAFRGRLGVQPVKQVRVSVAGGRYVQAPARSEISPVSGNPDLGPEGAWHVNLGVQLIPGPFLDVDIQGYLKTLDDQVVSSVSAADFANLATLGDEEREDDPTNGLSNSGIGRIWGMEVFARFAFLRGGAFSGWLSYSLSWAQRKDFPDEDWRWFQYDRRHALSVLVQVKLPGEVQIGARWQFQSGSPRTPIEGSTYYADAGAFVPVYGGLYSERGKPYHQLDIRIDKRIRKKDHVADVFIDILNVYAATTDDFLLYSFDYLESASFTAIPSFNFGVRVEF